MARHPRSVATVPRREVARGRLTLRMIRGMVADPTARTRDLSALKCLMYAGSPIAISTLKEAIEVFGATLYQLYAQSEAMPMTMLLPHHHRMPPPSGKQR